MNRRDFLRTGAVGALAGTAIPGCAAAPKRRPNLLYVFSDQHRAVSLPGEPYNEAIAPNLDRFRRANFSMERCISNYPLCTPYRGILMSGRWPQQTGLIHNNVALGRQEISLGRVFRDAGYRTGYVGKWHLQGRGNAFIPAGPDRQGFQDWHVWERTNAHYRSFTYDPDTGKRIQPKGWNCTLMTDQAVQLIEQRRSGETPWMMVVSWNPPHPPFNPPEEDARRYETGRLAKRPNAYLRPGETGAPRPLQSEDDLQRAMAGYYGAITGLDAEFQRLLDALDSTGQAQDTIVVYTSDHGEMMGSHGRMAKQVPFEESCRVPFFARYPGRTVPGGRSDQLFAAIDIYPTLCGLAGLPVPHHCVGRDLSAVMTGGHVAPGGPVFMLNQVGLEEGDGGEGGHPDAGIAPQDEPVSRGRAGNRTLEFVNLPSYRGLRTDTHTYAVAESGRWCLYDNVADPFQQHNLVGDPAQAPLMDGFDRQVMGWLRTTNDAFPYADAVRRVSSFPS